MIRVLLADDHTLVREGLKQLLARATDIQIVGEAANGAEVLQQTRTIEADLLLLDMSMPGRSGVELIRQVHSEQPGLRILVLTMHEEHQYAVRAIKAGAAGYMTKDSASDRLLAAIRKVAEGGAYISPEVGEQFVLKAIAPDNGTPHTALSDREFQVFDMLANGTSVSDIANQLNLSIKTISTHKSNLMRKMNLANQTELIRYAIRHGLLPDANEGGARQ